MDTMKAIMTRRSTRRMKDELPPKELIGQIIEAGRAAPSGSNSQTTHLIVITKKEVLAELAAIVQDAFAAMDIGPDAYVSLRHSVNAAKKGNYVFHYGAPVLIVTANKKGYGNAIADSACALENMMIAANSLGLGSCWIHRAKETFETEEGKKILQDLGINDEYEGIGNCIIGYAAEDALKPQSPRKENYIYWIK